MVGFSSWFSREAPDSSPITPSTSHRFWGNGILSGRVTKRPWSSRKRTYDEANKSDDGEASISIKKEDGSDSSDYDGRPESPDPIAKRYDNILPVASIEDELLPKSPEHSVHRRKRVAREAAEDFAKDESLSESDVSSTTQETNKDYDPEDGWRYEQVFLNQILRGRDEYTLMPSTWKMHFRGIPLPDGLFYIKTHAVSIRPRIYARTDRFEYRGAIALRRLMDIHGRIHDIRKAKTDATQDEDERRIVKYIRGRVQDALRWAELDGGIAKYSSTLPPNVRLIEMYDADKKNMHIPIQARMAEAAASWREILERVPEDQRPVPPVIFGLVIFKHILFIVTINSEDPDARCHIPIQVNLSEKNQNQWNALAIMVTICWARDLFADVAGKIPNLALDAPNADSDPDV